MPLPVNRITAEVCRCEGGCLCSPADVAGLTVESQVDHQDGDPICRCWTSDGCVCPVDYEEAGF